MIMTHIIYDSELIDTVWLRLTAAMVKFVERRITGKMYNWSGVKRLENHRVPSVFIPSAIYWAAERDTCTHL